MRRKPKEIAAGKAYRVYEVFSSSEPSDDVALVLEIRPMTKTSRTVVVEWLRLGGHGRDRFNYSEFMQRIHSEVHVQ